MKESVKITVIAAGFREIANKKSNARPSYLPKTWKAGRDPQPASVDTESTSNAAPVSPVVHQAALPQQPSPVQQPNIIRQVARNVSEVIQDIPDDLDVPTFLRRQAQKA